MTTSSALTAALALLVSACSNSAPKPPEQGPSDSAEQAPDAFKRAAQAPAPTHAESNPQSPQGPSTALANTAAPSDSSAGSASAQSTSSSASDTQQKGARPVGEACSQASECESGVCEGEGCGPNQARCVAKNRACTRDLRPYCGCDGQTFRTSGSCPGRPFRKKGECTGE